MKPLGTNIISNIGIGGRSHYEATRMYQLYIVFYKLRLIKYIIGLEHFGGLVKQTMTCVHSSGLIVNSFYKLRLIKYTMGSLHSLGPILFA